MRFRDAIGDVVSKNCIRKAEICGFQTIAEADIVAAELKLSTQNDNGYDVLTFAAGHYYVLLITPDFVEDTDVTHTNP